MEFQSQAAILAESLRALRSAVQSVEMSPDADSAFASVQASHSATASLLEQVIILVTTMASLVRSPLGQQQGEFHRPLSECRCVSNLKLLGSDKSEFKSWNDKFINVVAQSLGTHWRKFMKNLNQTLDRERKVLITEELDAIEGAAEMRQKESTTC